MATVYLVTGANSGLGLEFVRQLSQKNNVFIYATVRDISKATELNEIASKRKNVQVVAYQSEDDGSYLTGTIAKGHGKVDTIIANADVAEVLRPVADTPRSEFRRIFELSLDKRLSAMRDTSAMWEAVNFEIGKDDLSLPKYSHCFCNLLSHLLSGSLPYWARLPWYHRFLGK